jgi:hypothetical protein
MNRNAGESQSLRPHKLINVGGLNLALAGGRALAQRRAAGGGGASA